MTKMNAASAAASAAIAAAMTGISNAIADTAQKTFVCTNVSKRERTRQLRARSVLRAIENGCHHVETIVDSTQYSAAVVRRVAAKLAAEGKITATKSKRWDSQVGYARNMFGGAGVCIRRFWVYAPVKSA